MATAIATVNYDKGEIYDNLEQHALNKYGSIGLQASPATYATGGIPISWIVGDAPKVVNTTPQDVFFYSGGGTGYSYVWNRANNKIQIFTGAAAQSPGAELTNGSAIPAAVSGDTIRFWARFSKAF